MSYQTTTQLKLILDAQVERLTDAVKDASDTLQCLNTYNDPSAQEKCVLEKLITNSNSGSNARFSEL